MKLPHHLALMAALPMAFAAAQAPAQAQTPAAATLVKQTTLKVANPPASAASQPAARHADKPRLARGVRSGDEDSSDDFEVERVKVK
jgi:hypothetical protein